MSVNWKLPLSGFAALALTACGGGSEATDPPATPEPAPAEETVAEPETPKPEAPAASEKPPAAPTATEAKTSPEFEGLPEPYASADYARGKRVFRTCSSCHLLDPDAGNLVGPNLHGMFDRKSGGLDGFGYSSALQEADFQWTAEKLDEWLVNPKGFLPGNNMSFTGVRRERDRDAVIAYLLVETAK